MAYDTRVRGLSTLLFLLAVARGAAADQNTPLLEDDLRANKRKTIDAKDPADAELDAALGDSGGFSTKALASVEDRIRDELRRDRPRASPRLVVFMYPGRVSKERLKAMREVNVDVELTIDPCSRTVCDDALGKHIEIVGRAIGQPVLKGDGFSIVYRTLTLKAETDVRGDELITVSLPVPEAINASKKPGGGVAFMQQRRHQETDYVPLMTKAIAQKAAQRRVSLAGPPSVSRGSSSGSGVEVSLKLHADRSRQEQQILDAIAATSEALRSNAATPSQGRIEIAADTGARGSGPSRYRCAIESASLFSQGKLDSKTMLASYVEKVNDDKSAQRMDLDSGPGGDDGPAPDDNEAIEVIGQNFSSLGACAKAEAASNPKFRGVTIVIAWSGSGRAEKVDVKEPALKSGALPGCLRRAFEMIRLPKFGGGTRQIEYPIRLK
jgi:hypothetical protein